MVADWSLSPASRLGDVATCFGAGGAPKRQYQGNEAFEAVVVFPPRRVVSKEDSSGNVSERKILSFAPGHFVGTPRPL
jgi:hypothetical protein